MASYHCTVKVGAKGKAAAHAQYIAREGKYEKGSRYEDLESSGHGNMPKWAEENPNIFWQSADEHERANGATYREIEAALPRELNAEQRREFVEDFIERELGDRHAFQYAIHVPKAALEKGEQPHVHIIYSERTRDGIDRDPDQYFKRYNAKKPEKGGCKKDSAGTEERLLATRQRWAEVQNEHLARHGHSVRVDHRSLKDQGIDRAPEKHLGPKRIKKMTELDVSAILERRAAEGELTRASAVVSSIDVSGDLAAALKERDLRIRQHAKEQAAKAWDLMKQTVSQPVVAPKPQQPQEMLVARSQARIDEAIRKNTEAGLVKPRQQEPPKPDMATATAGVAAFRAQYEAAKTAEAAKKAEAARIERAQELERRLKQQRRGRDQDVGRGPKMGR